MSSATARLFFALWPSEAMQVALAETVAEIARDASANTGGRAVPAKNFHLTLLFLGSVTRSRVPALVETSAQFAQTFRAGGLPLQLALDSVECWSKSQILCATARETPPALISLAESLQRALIADVVDSTPTGFRPHVTLARKVARQMKPVPIAPHVWRFSEFVLVESHVQSTGSVYEIVASFPL